LADWFKTVFMEDSETGGKDEMQERNRTVVYFTREKVERDFEFLVVINQHFRVFQFRSNRRVCNCTCRFRANLYLPPFPARTFHALLPLCPNMESSCPTPPPPENYIIGQHATGSHCHAISRRGGRGTGRFHTRSKRPDTPRGNA